MTPLVKLVFGASYDKTRLAEYACVLAHAMRRDIPRGGLADLLAQQPGGLKAIVQIERKARRARDEDAEKLCRKHETRQRLRAAPAQPVSAVDLGDSEFAVLVARRDANGTLGVIGIIGEDDPVADRILRKIAG